MEVIMHFEKKKHFICNWIIYYLVKVKMLISVFSVLVKQPSLFFLC